MIKKRLYTRKIKGKGRGVFCDQHISKDEIIETSPLLVIPANDYDTLTSSQLVDYFFNFNKEEQTLALVLGFGSLYNHTKDSNAAYNLDQENKEMTCYALKDIPPHTEICINYGGEPGNEFKEWFESRNILYKS